MGIVAFKMTYDPDMNVSVGVGVGNRQGTPSETVLGTIQSDDSLSVAPGWNQLVAHGRFTAQGKSADILIQRFLNGKDTLLSAGRLTSTHLLTLSFQS